MQNLQLDTYSIPYNYTPVGLHFKTDHPFSKSPYLFFSHINFKIKCRNNCVKITNNSLKSFGDGFGAKSKNPLKSTPFNFSDNSIQIPNFKNTTLKS